MDKPDWSEALRRLAGYADLSIQTQTELSAADFSLEGIRKLLGLLGHPEQHFPCLHIAGTNGKGSVSALCTAALEAQGYRVGQFTSPHMAGHFAGIQISGSAIPPEKAMAQLDEMLGVIEQIPGLTQFEIVTALALRYFAEENVNAAVIETGLGGRLDATNVIVPVVSAITAIDLEHQSILGQSLAEIATHKAGIIKARVPVVIAPQEAEAREVLLAEAERQSAPLREIGRDVLVEMIEHDLSGQAIAIWWADAEKGSRFEARLGLLGAHQAQNAALAYTALKVSGIDIEEAAIRQGFAKALWLGRFEVLQTAPPVVLDAAHTPAAARALGQALDDYFPGKGLVLLLGVSSDKNLEGVIGPLREPAVKIFATQSRHPRAMPARELAGKLLDMGLEAQGVTEPAEALEMALEAAGDGYGLLCFGSVFLVEQVRELWLKNHSAIA